ncbi:uncharacterized protein B0I36DRAFT_314099 [Microdochium trichocladiopsis]|uniref:Uncharacterized protein n=1 Tax=Microdochium trichocladiopsis TaxID=1682393 RepID=A0A9P9BTW9_9PEZI|nr:uncharacterized protein B0I36DRAFT_314099 [Microdochium trichocladiopsis]KAH7037452.1 hypothetical protein B0I36DRAFT_314099 [Microdochium trichocladiopsis]
MQPSGQPIFRNKDQNKTKQSGCQPFLASNRGGGHGPLQDETIIHEDHVVVPCLTSRSRQTVMTGGERTRVPGPWNWLNMGPRCGCSEGGYRSVRAQLAEAAHASSVVRDEDGWQRSDLCHKDVKGNAGCGRKPGLGQGTATGMSSPQRTSIVGSERQMHPKRQ